MEICLKLSSTENDPSLFYSTIHKAKMLKGKTDVQRLSVTVHSSFHGI